MRRLLLRLLITFFCFTAGAHAQATPNQPSEGTSVGLRVTTTFANSPPGSCGCFQLLGGAGDVALPLTRSLSAVVQVAGNHAGNVPGTQRGLSTISLLAGPRYPLHLAQRQSIFVQGLFGAARGFDAVFQTSAVNADTATVFSYEIGGAYEFAVTSSLALRPAQVNLVQTNLPNGTDNRQRNLQFGAGVVLHLHMTSLQR